MQVTNHESDFDRRVFVAYVLTVVAALLLAIRIDLFANFSTTVGQASEGLNAPGYGWLEKLGYATRGGEYIGLAVLGASYLLMLDSDEEPKAMKVAISVTAFMGLVLAVCAVLSIANELISHSVFITVGPSSKVQAISDALATGVLGFSALALTWPFVSDLWRPASSVSLADDGAGADAGDPESGDE